MRCGNVSRKRNDCARTNRTEGDCPATIRRVRAGRPRRSRLAIRAPRMPGQAATPMAVTERHESRSQRRASVISVCQCRDSWKHRPEASIFRIGQDVASAQTRRFEPRVRQVDTAAARVSPDAEHDVAQLHGWPRNSLRHRANASCALGTSGASSTLSSRRRHKQYSKATSSRASGGMISGTSQKLRRLHLAMQRMSSASRRRWERALRLRRRRYATIDPRRRSAACAAASRATGTRAGAQET